MYYIYSMYIRMYVKAVNKNISLNTSYLLCFIPRDYLFGNSLTYFFLGWETIVGTRAVQ